MSTVATYPVPQSPLFVELVDAFYEDWGRKHSRTNIPAYIVINVRDAQNLMEDAEKARDGITESMRDKGYILEQWFPYHDGPNLSEFVIPVYVFRENGQHAALADINRDLKAAVDHYAAAALAEGVECHIVHTQVGQTESVTGALKEPAQIKYQDL